MADEKQKKQSKKRVEAGLIMPIDYYYVVGKSKTSSIEYVEVQQYLNDKFNGKLTQTQYFPIAEQSKRIYDLNKMLIERALDDAIVNEKIKFLVQVSAKWFSSASYLSVLTEYIQQMSENVIFCFDAVSLVREGAEAKDALKRLIKDYRLRFMLDNVEFQNLSQLIGYRPDYIRLDARFIDKSDERYTESIKFLREFCKAQRVKSVMRNIKDDVLKNYLLNNGFDVVEGNGVYTPKKKIASIIKDFKL